MSILMRKVLAVSVLVSCQLLWAQSPTRDMSSADADMQRRMQQEEFERWALGPDPTAKADKTRQAAELSEFYSKARHFVDLWQAFANELNAKKTFNAKLAKQVSKAFHDLETSDGWPVGRSK
jgi:hypothetical protein